MLLLVMMITMSKILFTDAQIKKLSKNKWIKNIIYISCDPNTLMRDLKILGNIYSIKEITPYNLFPKTYHCESITDLERR